MTALGKKLLVSFLIANTIFFGWYAFHIDFDFELEKFFPKNHPESLTYQQHAEEFGYDNDFLQIILERKSGVFETSFLSNAMAFEAALKDIPDVLRVYSPLSLKHIIKSPTGVIAIPLMHTNPEKFRRDSSRIFENPLYSAAFGKDGNAVSIYVQHAHFSDPQRGDAILQAIQSNAKKFGVEQVRLVGKLSASKVFIGYIQDDFGKFLAVCLIASYLLLVLVTRSFRSALLPFLISLLTLIWTFGLMSLLELKINLLSSLLPPILFFVSMSDAVHLINAYGKDQKSTISDRTKNAIRIVFVPTLLTSLTTAIGFLSLLWINIEPVKNLGVFTAIGILIAFLNTFSLGVLVAPGLGRSRTARNLLPADLPEKLLKRRKIIVFGAIALLICATPGVLMLKVDAYLLDDLPKQNKIRQDFEYADLFLGGSKPYEIRLEVADSSKTIWDKNVMDEIVKIEEYLLNSYRVSKVQSPATIIKYLHMATNGGLNRNYLYPEETKEYDEVIELKNRIDPKRMNKLVNDDSKTARLIGFIPELGSRETAIRNNRLIEHLATVIDQDLLNYKITGTTYLIDRSHEFLSRNLILGILTAMGVISIVLALYFKSWRLIIISLIPNLIPLVLVAGIIGWAGISLKMTTAIIFTIVFGIAVDDTIHMISHYLRYPGSHREKLTLTFKHAGNALLITTLVISAGFSVFLLSNFGATFYLGLLITFSLLIALIVDLTLLPILLKYSKK